MLQIDSLSVQFGESAEAVQAVRNFSLDVPDGRFVALVGPSGCGKSTLLRCIAGLQRASFGKVLLDGKEVNAPDGRTGFVFQNADLFPWLTVEKNIGFGAAVRAKPEQEQRRIIQHYLDQTGLTEFRTALPHTLSGGMKQRTAIARTLANDPAVVLMDEPFAALDTFTRASMQEFLLQLWEEGKKTIVFVTHDVEEAIFLADDVHVLTSRPMTLSHTYSVPFMRPRRQELKQSQEFFELRNEILRCLQQGKEKK